MKLTRKTKKSKHKQNININKKDQIRRNINSIKTKDITIK